MIRILLDGIEYEDVTGLEKAKLNIVRDESVKGLLIKFIDDVTFYGAAYDAILDYANTNGDCSRMPVDVYFGDEDGDGVQFSGFLSYKDPETKINKTTRHLTTKIQQGDLSNFIIDKLDYVFPVNVDFCIDGVTALTPITDQQCQYFIPTGGGTAGYTGNAYETYLVKDVLTQALEYLSNGAITLNAPILDTPYIEDRYQINYNTWASGETMTIRWTNFYGQTWEASELFGSGNLVSRCVHEASTLTDVRRNYFQKFSYYTVGVPPVVDDALLGSYLPFTNVSISVSPPRGGANPVITQDQTFQFGLENLGITRRSVLQDEIIDFRISLGQLLRHLTQVFNLTFSFQYGSNGLEMLLQPTEDYFTNTQVIDLGNMRQVDSAFSEDFAISQLNTPNGLTDAIFEPTTWRTEVCIGSENTVSATGFSSQDFTNALNGDDKDDLLLWSMLELDAPFNRARWFPSNFMVSPVSAGTRSIYNAPYFSPLRCYNYFINSNLDYTQIIKTPLQVYASCIANCDSGTIPNDNSLLIDTAYTFQGALTLEQTNTLISNNTQFIRFAVDNVEYDGFINDISIDLNTKMTTFELLAGDIKQ